MKKKYLLLITLIISLIIIVALILYNNKNKESPSLTVEATILIKDSNYLLVTTEDNIDYLIYCKNLDYELGDTLKLELKDIDKTKTPIESTLITATLLHKNTQTDTSETTNNNNQVEHNQTIVENNQEKVENEQNSQNKEDKVITYFENLDEELNNDNNNESISTKIKNGFVSCIDFIFYDKEIEGITFKELTDNTKLKILEITLSIDKKIENKFPNYKNNINGSYQNIKSKIVEKYLDITTNICNKDEALCNKAKESFQTIKNGFGITWNTIKELVGKGTTKLKQWYEIWRYK